MSLSTPGAVVGTEVYARTPESARALWAKVMGVVGESGVAATDPTLYERLLDAGVLDRADNLVGRTP